MAGLYYFIFVAGMMQLILSKKEIDFSFPMFHILSQKLKLHK